MKVKISFRSHHYYSILGGLESCPHTHTYTVEVLCEGVCEEVKEVLDKVKKELEGRFVNDWKKLKYSEPTTENLAVSIYSLLPPNIKSVAVREDETVMSIYDGKDVWVVIFKHERNKVSMVGVKGKMNSKGFAADISEMST